MSLCAALQTVKAKIKQEKALEEARRASEAKTDFLANTSHEIRTPINAVLGMNEMIMRESSKAEKLKDGKPSDYQEAFKKIRQYSGNVDSAGNTIYRTMITDAYSELFGFGSACNRLDFSAYLQNDLTFNLTHKRLSVRVDNVSTLTDFRAWLASNPLSVVYKLATPATEQVIATPFPLTDGTNTIYTNMTTVSVEYVQREED